MNKYMRTSIEANNTNTPISCITISCSHANVRNFDGQFSNNSRFSYDKKKEKQLNL